MITLKQHHFAVVTALCLSSGCARTPATDFSASHDHASAAGADLVWSVGHLLGISGLAFSAVLDVAVDTRGRVFVVDEPAATLTWLNADGHIIGQTQGNVDGGGFFIYPVAVDISDDDLIHVLDSEAAEVRTYALDGTALHEVGRIEAIRGAEDLCFLNDRYFLLKATEVRAIRSYDRSGVEVDSWVLPFTGPALWRLNPRFATPWQSGFLICDELSQVLVFVSRHTPLLMAFTPDGQLRWRTRLPDFHTEVVDVISTPAGDLRFEQVSSPQGRFSKVRHASLLRDGRMAITVEDLEIRKSVDDAGASAAPTQSLYFLSAATGDVTYAAQTSTRVVAVIDSLVIGYSVGGLPQVSAWRISEPFFQEP